MNLINVLFVAGGLLIGLAIGLFIIKQSAFSESEHQQKAARKLEDSKREGEELIRRARAAANDRRESFAFEEKEFKVQLEHLEKNVERKEQSVQKHDARMQELTTALAAEEKSAHEIKKETETMESRIIDHLVQMTGIARENAREELMNYFEMTFKNDGELRIQRALELAQETHIREARNILSQAIYRYADSACRESSDGTIHVKHDDFKGRLVGRGGHNIGYFEELFGVDVVFNDEPNTIVVNCFNLVVQETAKYAIQRLAREKIINDEVIARVKVLAESDMARVLRTEGEKVLKAIGLYNQDPELAKLVGRLKYRTSYGQNVLKHCLEVGYFAKLLAAEIGADEKIALYGGFFHDIGKAIDQEVGGSHDALSKEILEKYGFSWEITHAAWTHHNAIPQETIEARIVQAADAISAGRPGARAESVERYVARIKELQEMAFSFGGVRKAYAINAGREVRVVVDPDRVFDNGMTPLAENIAKKVQDKGGYPGKIKIVTIRSTRVTTYGRKGS